MPKTTDHAGTALVDLLAAHGVTTVFGVPGGQTNALYDGVALSGGAVRHVPVRDERTAAYAADAHARLTGRVGVCDATVGPGTAKLPSGLGEAFNSSIPVLAIVSELPTATETRRHRGATSQAMDQEALLAPVTKWVGTVRRSEDLAPVVRRAFREATTGRPGPVAVVLAQDVLDGPRPASLPADPLAGRFGRFPAFPAVPDGEDVAALAARIDGARRPLLVLGGGARRPGVGAIVASLADRAGLGVVTTLSGKGAVDEAHPAAVGVLASLGMPSAQQAAREADLLVLVGTKFGSGTTLSWELPAEGQEVVQVDVDPVEIGRDDPVTAAVLADAVATLEVLAGTIRERERPEWRARLGELRDGWEAERRRQWASDATPIDPQRVMGALQGVLAPADVVVADASLSSGWVASYLEVGDRGPVTLLPRGLAGLGWAIPAAIGAGAALEAGRVVAVMGDGAAAYAIGELSTLVEQGTPALLVVLNNTSLGWIRWYRRVSYGRGWEEPDSPPTSFAKIASGYEIPSWRVEDPAALDEILAEATATDGPALVEVVTSMWETPIAAHREALESQRTAAY